jgi:glycosyltransferase involved in cell wall biosynthesis
MEYKEAILFSDSTQPSISIVVPALNEGDNLARTVENLRGTLPGNSEIVVVDDGSSDGCADSLQEDHVLRVIRCSRLGSASARNVGALQAQGEIVVFADAHIEAPPKWWMPLTDALRDPAVGAVAPVISVMGNQISKGYGMRWKGPDFGIEWLPPVESRPHPVGLAPGCLLAMRRDVFNATGGFDDGMKLWGMEDSELSLRLWLLGYELQLVPSVEVAHLFRQKRPYSIGWTCVIHNMLRVAFCHFKNERIQRVVETLKGYRDFSAALALLACSDVQARRQYLQTQRRRDDDWFFQRFPMNL